MASKLPLQSPSQKSLILLFSLGQCLGVLPLDFVKGTGGNNFKFNWKSFKTIYSVYHIIFEVLTVIMCICYGCTVNSGWSFRHIIKTTFYASNLWNTIALMQLTRRLPNLMKRWHEFDLGMEKNYGYPNGLLKRTILTSLMAFAYATCQISIFVIFNYYSTKKIAKQRNIKFNMDVYFQSAFSQAFIIFPYSTFLGILCQLNYIFTYLRMVYIELLMSMFSSFLSLRFKQITERLNLALGKKKDIDFWREVREDYDKVCILCRNADDQISNVVFSSFAGNLFLMLAYLRNCTIFDEMDLQKIYNTSAFIILLIRCLVMLLYVSWVNDESKEPAFALNSVSSAQYNSEIHRFLLQLSFDDVAFTGNKMFRLTRTLILNIGGVILTYELVLVQFAEMNIFN